MNTPPSCFDGKNVGPWPAQPGDNVTKQRSFPRQRGSSRGSIRICRISMFDQLPPLMPAMRSFGTACRPCSAVVPLDFRQAGHHGIRVIHIEIVLHSDPRPSTVVAVGTPHL